MAETPVKYWSGSVTNCDVCEKALPKNLGSKFVDGMIRGGPWAVMCMECFAQHGAGLGTGLGQEYTFDPNGGRWLKTKG